MVPAGRTGAQDQCPGAHQYQVTSTSSGHREDQQQGFTQALHCWSCGELEGMGETTGLGQGTPRTPPRMTSAGPACG